MDAIAISQYPVLGHWDLENKDTGYVVLVLSSYIQFVLFKLRSSVSRV